MLHGFWGKVLLASLSAYACRNVFDEEELTVEFQRIGYFGVQQGHEYMLSEGL